MSAILAIIVPIIVRHRNGYARPPGGEPMDTNKRTRLIRQYRDGYRVVTEALDGVSDEELDHSASGEWTPRQIAHHLADSEMMSAIRIRRLLAEPEPSERRLTIHSRSRSSTAWRR